MSKAKKETMQRYYEDPLHVEIKRLHGRKSGYKRRRKWEKVAEMEREIDRLKEVRKQRGLAKELEKNTN